MPDADDASRPDDPIDLSRLYEGRRPSPELEGEIVDVLRADRLLGAVDPGGEAERGAERAGGESERDTDRRRAAPTSVAPWRVGRTALRAAAAVLFFLSGWAIGTTRSIEDGGAAATHMLLLWEPAGFAADAPPGEIAARYAAWASDASAGGVTIEGDELGPQRTRLGADPRPPTTPVLGGYFLVGGDDETVVELADTHPHLRLGGWIEVAPITRR